MTSSHQKWRLSVASVAGSTVGSAQIGSADVETAPYLDAEETREA